jgi:hypothetical protein
MKMRLKNQFQTPHGSHFRLNLPAQGMVGFGSDFPALVSSCKTWRKANAWPIGLGFEDELETVVCQHYGHECRMDTTNLPQPKGVMHGDTIARGSRTLLAIIKARVTGTFQLVSQDEANARAAVCNKCPWKVTMKYSCGGACGEILELITATADKETTPPMGEYACGICQCFLKAAVWTPLDLQLTSLEQSVKDEFQQVKAEYPCWKDFSIQN